MLLALWSSPFIFFWSAFFGPYVLAIGDAQNLWLPVRHLAASWIKQGFLPLWNPMQFSGLPCFSTIDLGLFQPAAWWAYVTGPEMAINLGVALTHAIAAAGTFGYARYIGCSILGSSIAAFGFSYGGFMAAHIYHTSLLEGAAWLPVLLLCTERLRTRVTGWRLVQMALITTVQISGHAQIPVYNFLTLGLYTLWRGLTDLPATKRWGFFSAIGVALALGIGIAGVQIAPILDIFNQSSRKDIWSFDQYLVDSFPLAELPLFFFPWAFGHPHATSPYSIPYWGSVNWHEVAGYLGLLPWVFVAGALSRWTHHRFIRLWTAIGLFWLVVSFGNTTPLAHLMFQVPVFNLARCHARLVHLVGFSLSMLAAMGCSPSWYGSEEVFQRRIRMGAWMLGAGMLGLTLFLLGGREKLATALHHPLPAGSLSFTDPAVWVQGLLTILTLALVLWWIRKKQPVALAAMMACFLMDLWAFNGLCGWRTSPFAFTRPLAPPEAYRFLQRQQKNPHDFRFANLDEGYFFPGWSAKVITDLGYSHQLWNLQSFAGSNNFVTSRYTEFGGHVREYPTIFDRHQLMQHPYFLDVLNVRYGVVPTAKEYLSIQRLEGMEFPQRPLPLMVTGQGQIEMALSGSVDTDQLGLITSLQGGAAHLPDHTPAAKIRGWLGHRLMFEKELLVGDHTADWTWEHPQIRPTVRHREPPLVMRSQAKDGSGQIFSLASFLATLPLGGVRTCDRLTIHNLLPPALSLEIKGVCLYHTGAKTSRTLTYIDLMKQQRHRWKTVYRDDRVEVLENLLAFPRVWLVPRVVQLPPAGILSAFKQGKFNDQSPFDPKTTALVEERVPHAPTAPDPEARATITDYEPSRLRIHVNASRPTFLVLAEAFYPGWRAWIDGLPVSIFRTNYVMRGLAIPAGSHDIEFAYQPPLLYVGAGISLISLIGLALVKWLWREPVEVSLKINPPKKKRQR